MGLSEAAVAAGIPEDEAVKFAAERLKKRDATALELKALAEESFKVSMATLSKIAQAGPRMASSDRDEDGNTSTTTPINSDLDAAKALARLAIDAIKIYATSYERAAPVSPPGSNLPGGGVDLFDLKGPWSLKDATS